MDMVFQEEFLNAYTFAFCEKRGFTKGQAWRWALSEMARTTGCNAIILPVCAWQDHAYSTNMDSEGEDVMSREDVRNVCAYARQLGLKVILKAMVNCRDGYWRAYIRFFDSPVPTEPSWAEWFAAWSRHVCLTAEMAQENGADLFCIGCEMVGTDHREQEWREVIRQVRSIYTGPITYNCDKYQEHLLTWWDAVDVMSSSGYYPIGEINENFGRIQAAAQRAGKPFLFMECGCPSRKNSQHRPNDWRYGEGTDMAAQRDWYEAFTLALLRHPFVRGAGWWDWPASRLYPEQAGPDHNGYCTYGKSANNILLRFAEKLAR
ncbi:MAG: 1,4-beta-xylanase [Clostridia bacterium]|nr:1,4-beta-xylanase [Clostridia bacterium]